MNSTLLRKTIGSALLLLSMAFHTTTQADPPSLVAPTETYAGKTHAQWLESWFRWIFSIPGTTTDFPFMDATGANSGANQNGPVFFFPKSWVGEKGNPPEQGAATVPEGTALFLPFDGNYIDPNPNRDPSTIAVENRAALKDWVSHVFKLVVDGQEIPIDSSLTSPFLHATSVFTLPVPANAAARSPQLFGDLPEAVYPFQSHEWFVLLRPLPVGRHVVHISNNGFIGTPREWVTDIVWTINVVPRQFGLFTYERVGDEIEITNYPQDAGGAVEIPAVIEGLPVTRLGPKTFSGCTNLTHITIPESITQIGSIPGPVIRGGLHGWGTFYGCIELTSVTLPTRVTTLGAGAFEGCTSLTEVTIPETVTTLGDRAFAHCTGLTEVKILDGVTDIGRFMFWGCTGLTRVTIPGTVNALGSGAFADCTGLTEVTILEGVTGIGNGADDFGGGLPPGGSFVTAPFVWGAFEGCTSLTDVLVPASVSYLGTRSFARCNRLAGVAISAGVIGISDEAFLGCTALTRIQIPASVGAVGRRSFSDCTRLQAIDVDPQNRSYVSLEGVLFSKDPFALIRYPGGRAGGYTLPTGVATIESEAFSGCTGLTRVAIPGSVASIGFYPFAGCTGLKAIEVEVPNPAYASVDGVLFTKDGSLLVQYPGGKGGSYTLPNGVTRIGNGAFANCPGLTRVTIPDSLTTLGRTEFSRLRPRISSFGLFEGCPALTGLYFQGRGPNVESWEPSYAAGFTAYHLAGTEGWGATLLSAPTALWTEPLLLSDAPGSGVSADGFGFTISWAPNARVVVEASPQLNTPAWTPVGTNLLTGGSSRFTDPQWAAHPNRFYRLRTP